ncbi:MAG: FAD-dependent oxidoreductase [Bacteroidales bacterium]|jgi:2-polyprenyl-6-methoxyphenol hydroxylase-like FAD-dependent oxidoreductase|nr:FAD-dependent oxidoreductase [Bacteroidales bacterium]
MDRRNFLKTSGVTAAACLAATSLNSCSGILDGTKDISIKDVKDSYKTQLVVVGGGPAGVCAAIAAARKGVKAMILEQGGCLGGMATRGLVAPFMTCYDTEGEQQIIRGLFEEVVQRMVQLGGAIHPRDVRAGSPFTAWITQGHDHVTPFDAEVLKYVLDRMVIEAGVKVLFHASFVKPVLRGSKISKIIILTRSGLESIAADIFVDATGDGDLAFRSGVPCEYGNPETGRVQPATLFFHINKVDSDKLIKDVEDHLDTFHKKDGVSYRALHWHVAEAEAAGEWSIARKSVNIYRGVKPDEWAVNCTRIKNVDATNSESLTDAEFEGRRQVNELMNFFHKYVPGCEDATIKGSGATVGIRESRHIKGDYVLDVDDLLNGVVPEDSILLASNSVDVHGRGGDYSTEYITVKNGRWYGVPYRCLLPQGVDNLLIAGRSLSATSDAAGAVRVMPPCMAMGQAAGTAAALAIKGGCGPRDVDVAQLIQDLKSQDVFLV